MSTQAGLSRADLGRALAVVVIWGLNFVVMKLGLRDLSPMLLGALRFSAASLPLLFFVRKPALPWRYLLAYGLAQGLGQFGFLFLGLKLGMTAGMASVVMQTQAFFTLMLAAPLLGEHALRRQWIGIAVALAGLVLIATAHGEGPGQMTLIGFILTLSAAFMWASSNIVVRFATRAAADYDPFGFIVWSSLVPIVPFAIFAVLMEGPSTVMHQLANLDLGALLSVLYLAWFATLLAYSMWTRLLQRHPAGRVVPFSLLVPVVGLAAAALCFGERPSPAQWLGTAAVLLGLMINQGFGARTLALLRDPKRA
ncbi:EamA family transporter [Variovorax sp. YR216]|uniref:EamA family transporter n=1 Tax=Variovorax sp. YR216 TaxID=1882828 RepID=UPI00089B5BD4|nr:EamA family transporter [Variovorax sp. YR216]SEA57380.1 O-acetylserine/cysteine efflux transporter [Variovorax sp. YR216]